MAKKSRLIKSMSLDQFDNCYWYIDEIKDFTKSIGIKSVTRLRKDQLEKAIRHFIQTGEIKNENSDHRSVSDVKDSDKGLTPRLPVTNYTNNRETKDFILKEAPKIVPDMKLKSGARYRLNRWREDQINNGIKITYADIVRQFINLNQVEGSFPKVPHGRYINFIADFLRNERGTTRQQAAKVWKQLKKLDIPKDYVSWKRYRDQKAKK